jgi:hypothetical protein
VQRPRIDRLLRRLPRYAWAAPNSVLGLLLALAALGGGRLRVCEGVLECSGGALPLLLRGMSWWVPIRALTLGHVVLACGPQDLADTRDHERVHVGQYERWGPLFLPLYAAASLAAFASGRDAYRDNRFEVAARSASERR